MVKNMKTVATIACIVNFALDSMLRTKIVQMNG
nr:MAG TPA: hypothetical protein [Caudoviricetes sp.]